VQCGVALCGWAAAVVRDVLAWDAVGGESLREMMMLPFAY